ncbi:ABC transporter [uncultured Klebsiella sp.]|uniref:ABC transporter n=1 Tax=uncultured Klebsiella sp. TaxID=284011 RepID=UPI002805D2AD|nr:ABC transporter [uncultured Klebsiella sp.]
MVRFLIVWCVFSVRKWSTQLVRRYRPCRRGGNKAVRGVMRHTAMPLLFITVRSLCRLGVLGRRYRGRTAVATQNYRCLTGGKERIDTAWMAFRRQLLEFGATWGQHPVTLSEIQACTRELDAIVAPLVAQKTPVVLAPLHCVSDILAAIVGAGVTPGKASVVVSSSAESYTVASRKTGGVALSYCSIHQDNRSLASELMALLTNVSEGRENMIIFPDIPADYTVQTHEAQSGKINCRLFGRPAKLHNGVQRFSRIVSAQVVFYHLYYQQGIKIKIYPPQSAKEVATTLPTIIENTLRDYPQDWLLWHSHSLYFINH